MVLANSVVVEISVGLQHGHVCLLKGGIKGHGCSSILFQDESTIGVSFFLRRILCWSQSVYMQVDRLCKENSDKGIFWSLRLSVICLLLLCRGTPHEVAGEVYCTSTG